MIIAAPGTGALRGGLSHPRPCPFVRPTSVINKIPEENCKNSTQSREGAKKNPAGISSQRPRLRGKNDPRVIVSCRS